MAVVFDAQSTSDNTVIGTSITHNNLTVGSGTNRALIVMLILTSTSAGTPTVTWDSGGTNQACTLITGASKAITGVGIVSLYGLLSPTSGNKTLNATWTNSSGAYIAGVSYTGVDQTGVSTSFPHGTSASGIGSSFGVTVTSAVGNAVAAAHAFGSSSFDIVSVNNTQVFLDTSLSGSSDGAANRAAGASTVALSGAANGGDAWISVGTDILATVATTTPPINYDWPYPGGHILQTRYSSFLRSWTLNLVDSTLAGQDRIYGAPGEGVPNYDWPLPGRPFQFNRGFSLQFQPQFLRPFAQYDWPNPRDYLRSNNLRAWSDDLKIQLIPISDPFRPLFYEPTIVFSGGIWKGRGVRK